MIEGLIIIGLLVGLPVCLGLGLGEWQSVLDDDFYHINKEDLP